MVDTLALFDLDSTLLEGDCELIWCDYLLKYGIVEKPFMHQVKRYCVEYEIGVLDYVEFERYILSPVAAMSPARVQEILNEYLVQIRTLMRPRMLGVLQEHRSQGHILVLATASNSFVARPIAALLGIEHVVCTECELVDGVPSGKVIGKPAFRSGKVERVKEWVETNQASLIGSWGYSDSHNDVPILSMVEHAVAVSPDAQLRRTARQNGWDILDGRAQAL